MITRIPICENGNARYQNQHYVSQVLLRRFTQDRQLQRFSLQHNRWKGVSTKQVFSFPGYTQVLASGVLDNSLETTFHKLENKFNSIMLVLDDIATRQGTHTLPVEVFENLFWYCAFLWRMSPFCKAVAPCEFVLQLDRELEHGRGESLRLLGIQEDNIQQIILFHASGKKMILRGDDYEQVMYRIQFARKFRGDYQMFRHFVKWTVYNSPIELPISDIAFFHFNNQASNSVIYALPLSPNLILIGVNKIGTIHSSTETIIKSDTLTQNEAEYFLDAICLSGITAIACKTRTHDIVSLRKRGEEKGIGLSKLNDPDAVLSAGTKSFDGPLMVSPATLDEYKAFLNAPIRQEWQWLEKTIVNPIPSQ